MRLKEFIRAGEVEEAHGDLERVVTGLAYDSKRVERGNIFFCIPGTRVDGHAFAPQVLERGAAAVVVERKLRLPTAATWVRASNVRRTMGRWSAHYYSYPGRRLLLAGVTGTNGKTTVTYLLESILEAAGMPTGVIGTINYRYGGKVLPALHTTPESVELQALLARMVESGVRSVAMEASSHALALERVRGMDFDVAVFTNLSRDHLDFHSDMADYFLTKSRLFTDYLMESSKRKKIAVIHAEDRRGRELVGKARAAGLEVVTFGADACWDVHPLRVKSGLEGQRGKIGVGDQELEFSSRLVGETNLENILAAVAVGFALGLPGRAVAQGVARCEAVPGRLERIPNPLGASVLVDYAHTPDALERAICILRPLGRGKLVVVFGCGGDRDRGKRPLMGEIAGRLSDLVILTSDNPRSEEPLRIIEEIEAGVCRSGMTKLKTVDLGSRSSKLGAESSRLVSEKGCLVEPDRRAAIRLALRSARAGDIVLIAGKGHEDYQILGSKRIHFDDREVVREEMEKRQQATGNTC